MHGLLGKQSIGTHKVSTKFKVSCTNISFYKTGVWNGGGYVKSKGILALILKFQVKQTNSTTFIIDTQKILKHFFPTNYKVPVSNILTKARANSSLWPYLNIARACHEPLALCRDRRVPSRAVPARKVWPEPTRSSSSLTYTGLRTTGSTMPCWSITSIVSLSQIQ